MNMTTQVSVAGPAVAAIVNPDLGDLTVIVLGIIAIVAVIVDSVTQCKLKHVNEETDSKSIE